MRTSRSAEKASSPVVGSSQKSTEGSVKIWHSDIDLMNWTTTRKEQSHLGIAFEVIWMVIPLQTKWAGEEVEYEGQTT